MNMVRHNNIACYIDVVAVEMIKPPINRVISICHFKKLQPFITGECNEVKAVSILIVLKANRHALKILLFESRGLCHPHWLAEKIQGWARKDTAK
jgi:hypothetical protein